MLFVFANLFILNVRTYVLYIHTEIKFAVALTLIIKRAHQSHFYSFIYTYNLYNHPCVTYASTLCDGMASDKMPPVQSSKTYRFCISRNIYIELEYGKRTLHWTLASGNHSYYTSFMSFCLHFPIY